MSQQEHVAVKGSDVEIIEFQLFHRTSGGGRNPVHYGIDVSHVREIIKVPETTQYPNSHPSVLGIFNLREHIIPLVDLASWLRAETNAPLSEKRVIVTQFGEHFHGFLVDSVNRIYQIENTKMESCRDFQQHNERDCVQSVVRMDGRLILMLDFRAIIGSIESGLEVHEPAALGA
ncbi:CheW domain protein [Desulfurispirillum indicum S5]|uniref:CheW domain protein n=1 Tax=Desulfurispirillum indicum (strain ATCC BAA-1389 / DSM 22839 / S5) TaxID=653733 RepID=E6W4Z5_DESIS|nr:chemotaxis protein CheW [Desulfurispirillum indicum]ADU65971.1 CheW domain protein [Desulfurispirillum indicum S5]